MSDSHGKYGGVINPFGDDGKLVNLSAYPRLRAYLEEHEAAIAGRYIARKSPLSWYRTIDRIDPVLAGRPKLLVPDIKGRSHIVYEDGRLYPHHNLETGNFSGVGYRTGAIQT